MDYYSKLKRQITTYVFLVVTLVLAFIGGALWVAGKVLPSSPWMGYVTVFFVSVGLIIWATNELIKMTLEPLRFVWQAMTHIAPGHTGTATPDLEKASIGKELVTSMVLQIYQLASSAPQENPAQNQANLAASAIARTFPLPVFAVNQDQNVIYANESALKYINLGAADVISKNIYSVLDLDFSSDHTLDKWLTDSSLNKATATATWQRVRLKLADQQTVKQFDMAASYNKNSPEHTETIVTLFDRTEEYAQDDDGLSFVALAVHELRTPLTILRGFIEVFEDELGDKLNDEMRGFMLKMQASAQQLAGFVSNILNVARVEADQLELQLSEEAWPTVLKNALVDMQLRTQVHGKNIELQVAPNLPNVAVDKISIYEVIANLVDNAIKYSGNSSKILVTTTINQDGLVETSIQDYGVGIPGTVIPHLFEKFQRNHRNRAQIGGTGLGLYLSRAIVSAHGGNIWVQSKEGEGSTFTFTLKPYSTLADELKNSDNKGIVRNAHGWIKNHSMYRR